MLDKKALILGITGQDGILLSNLLVKKGYQVTGFFRHKKKNKLLNEKIKKIYKKKITENIINQIIKNNNFNEIYFLIGQSEAFSSLKYPEKSLYANFIIFTFIIHSCIKYSKKPKIFYASSGQIFGNLINNVNENTKKNPANPYALSKYISMEYINFIRKFYNLNIAVGIFYNHDSEYRSNNNISKKIINFLNKKDLKNKKLKLGNINIYRDWGYAKEYVEAVYKITISKYSEDFIIATSKSLLLKDVIKYAFNLKKLDYKKYIKVDKKKYKNNEIKKMSTNITKIKKKIKWFPKKNLINLLEEQILKKN